MPQELTWNLTDLFSSYEAWEDALVKIEEDLVSIGSFKGRLHEGADVLLDCLMLQEKLLERLVRAAAYTHLRKSEDLTNPVNQADASRMAALQAKLTPGFHLSNRKFSNSPKIKWRRT